jgi:FSR family fosmidomycin resistance protein-like MFS transporter
MVPFLIIMGLLGGTYHAPASSFISQVLPPEKRGQALGLHFTGGSFSFFLTPALALGIATLFDSWRSSFFILALPALLASTILWLTTEEPQDLVLIQSDQKNDHDSNSNQDRITWFQIIRAIGLLVSLAILLNVVFASANSYMPLYMVDHHNISPRWAGIVVSVIAGAGIIGAPLGGALSDRLGRKQLIRVRMPSTESLIADVVPVGKRTTVLAIYFFLGMETASIVTPIVGRLIDIFGLDHVFTVMAACLCMIAGVALLFRKRI